MRRRKAVHRRAGDVIDEWDESAPIDDRVAALAFHATGSGIADRIVTWNRRAADEASAKGAMEIAEQLLRSVVDAQREVRADSADRRDTYRQLATAAERAGHPQAALDALIRASRLTTGDERGEIAVERSRLLEKLGRYRAALVTSSRALSGCADPATRCHLQLARATIHNFRGEWTKCLDLTRRVLDGEGVEGSDLRVMAQAHLLSEWCCTASGLSGAAEHADAAERLWIGLDDSIGLANLYLNRGISAWSECRVVDAVADFEASAKRYRRAGDVVGAAVADNNLGELLTLQHRIDSAEPLLVRARRVMEAADYPNGVLGTTSGLSRIAAWRGESERALAMQSEALEGFRALGADDLVADSLVRIVEIHVIAGDADAALAATERARRALDGLGEVPVLPATLARLHARALLLSDRTEEARLEFEHARAWAERDSYLYEITLRR